MLYVGILCIFFDIIYIICKKKNKNIIGLLAKMLAAFCFITIGYYAYKINSSSFNYFILLGLICDGIGDLFLALRSICFKMLMFVLGCVSFLIGHIMYIVALYPINNDYKLQCILLGVLIGTLIYSMFNNICHFKKGLTYLGIVYFVMITLMVCLGVGVYLTNNGSSNLVFMLGSLLFVSSDCILTLYYFSTKKSWMHPVYSFIYFLGQILISLSLTL